MKIQIASDLHNEFGAFEYGRSDADLFIFAGDIDIGQKGFDWMASHFKDIPVLYVLGNHEYYKHTYPGLLNKLRTKSKDTNIHILEKEAIEIGGITFHGTTLWTNFELFGDPKIAGYECQQMMNDYKRIRRDPWFSKLRSIDTHLMFYESLNWLRESLKHSSTERNVVITHHAPSRKSIPEHFKDHILSAAYASDLDEFIKQSQADLWVHGHIHEHHDYCIGQTRVVCNPRGYPDEDEHGYLPKWWIEID